MCRRREHLGHTHASPILRRLEHSELLGSMTRLTPAVRSSGATDLHINCT